jgi:hypothetical protein
MKPDRWSLVLTIFLAASTVAAQTHPSLEGTWVMDKARSQYPAESLIEIIHQHGDAIDISTTEQSQGHANPPMQLHLTTDGKPATNTVGPNTFISRSHWEQGKLVTFVEGDRGQHMTETRQLSDDGNTLTVTGYHQDELTKPYYVQVLTRKR